MLLADGLSDDLRYGRVRAAYGELHGNAAVVEGELGAHEDIVTASVDTREQQQMCVLALGRPFGSLARLHAHELDDVLDGLFNTSKIFVTFFL